MAELLQPINPFANDPGQTGGMTGTYLQQPMVTKPADLAPAPKLAAAPTAAQTANATQQRQIKYMQPMAQGLAAGATVGQTTNSESAVLNTLGAGAAGVASGAAVGGVYGAVVGGVVGLVSGGIQSYTGLKDARAKKRAADKDAAYIKKWNEDERKYAREQDEYNKGLNAQSRADGQEQTRYARSQNALASQWKAFQSTMDIINTGIKDDERIRAMFVKEAR
jgi:outer membrane lipoprotein SlyB